MVASLLSSSTCSSNHETSFTHSIEFYFTLALQLQRCINYLRWIINICESVLVLPRQHFCLFLACKYWGYSVHSTCIAYKLRLPGILSLEPLLTRNYISVLIFAVNKCWTLNPLLDTPEVAAKRGSIAASKATAGDLRTQLLVRSGLSTELSTGLTVRFLLWQSVRDVLGFPETPSSIRRVLGPWQ